MLQSQDGSQDWGVDDSIRVRLAGYLLALLVCVLECCATCGYWACYIKPTAGKFLPRDVVVPEDMKGQWAHSLWDCCSAPGICLCHTVCTPCAVAELWYRAGWIHTALESSAAGSAQGRCPGWPWFVGVCAWCIAGGVAPGCMPCGYAALRGGLRWVGNGDGGFGEIEDHRKRFGLPHEGLNTFCEDCCLWCLCAPCAATQEHRQVMALLDRGELTAAPPVPTHVVGQVVGAPVEVCRPVIGANATFVQVGTK